MPTSWSMFVVGVGFAGPFAAAAEGLARRRRRRRQRRDLPRRPRGRTLAAAASDRAPAPETLREVEQALMTILGIDARSYA
jgi:hypothetical protein